ncbi:MAG: iron-containing alcohol dehydrogenase [Alkalilacustris sp.]
MPRPIPAIPGFTLALPAQIRFGRGLCDQAAPAIAALGSSVLVVRSASVEFAQRLADDLRTRGCKVTLETARGEPSLSTLEALLATHRACPPEVVVGLGGGSALDLAKAVAALLPSPLPPLAHLEVVGEGQPLQAPPLPFVALPTTAGTGAEVTRNAVIGVEAHARKMSLRDPRMIADLVIVDPALTDGCPRAVTLASGLDAITQLIEPYLSRYANPFTDALCAEAIAPALRALVRLMTTEDPAARDRMAQAGLASGLALANAGLGAVHGLAGVAGGMTGAPHGALCGAMLVPALRVNRAAVAAAGATTARFDRVERWISEAFDTAPDTALDTLEGWMDRHDLPTAASLIDTTLVTRIARDAAASSSMRGNPVDLDPATLETILTDRRGRQP